MKAGYHFNLCMECLAPKGTNRVAVVVVVYMNEHLQNMSTTHSTNYLLSASSVLALCQIQ